LEQLGGVLTREKKFAEATAAYKEAHRGFADPALGNDPAAAARLDWNLSGVLADEGKVDDALARLEKFLALKPSGPAAYERYADLLRRLGRSDAVPAGLARLADANPKNRSIRWVLAAELGRTDPAAGARQFQELLDDPRTIEPEFFRRLVRFDKGHDRAGHLLTTADQLFRAAHGGRADGEIPADAPPADRGATERARAFTATVRAEPGLASVLVRQLADDAGRGVTRQTDTWQLAAGLAERDGQLAAAETLLRRAVRNGAADRQAAFTLLDLLAKQRKWAALKAEASRIIARPGASRNLWYDVLLATAHAELGEAAQALSVIDGVIPNAQDKRWARHQKVVILNTLGRHKEAVAECLDLLADANTPAEARQTRIALSNAYLGTKEYIKAEAELRQALDDDPDDVLVLNNLGYNLADQGRKLPEAEELVRRAVELDRDERLRHGSPQPESGIYLDSLGWVLFRRGKLAESRATLERAASLPDAAVDPVVWDHLGDACFRLGDRPAARRAWERAADLYTDSHQGREAGRRAEALRKLKQVQ
jgi:tetratricopeptide (TPR) repeat protein